MHKRPDGIVDFDKSICIGCKACIAACPYDAIFINPEDHSAEKCNLCAHRLDVGLEPACVVVCPTQALLVGDMTDPQSEVSRIIHRDATTVRKPEKETQPKLFYKGADSVTLDPLAARRPDGGLFMWSEQGDLPNQVPSGHPGEWNSSAAALLSYDIPHRAPWDWRVGLYTFTKSIAAGAYLVPLLLAMSGMMEWASPAWTITGPILALTFLGITGVILIWDLEHPERFWMVLAKPQWRSWLVRGGFIISGYGALLVAHLGAVVLDNPEVTRMMAWAGGPLALGTAIYTAYLLAQAKARDLWQSPLLPTHFCVQALLAGAGALLLANPSGLGVGAAWVFSLSTLLHLVLAGSEATMGHATAHGALAARNLLRGPQASAYWSGLGLSVVSLVLVGSSAGLGAAVGLVGLLLFEHAFIQAGQSVPLA